MEAECGEIEIRPGPGWKRLRTYALAPAGISVTRTGLNAKGEPVHVSYTYDFDGKDYPMVGSANYDTLSAERIDAAP